jgi:nucleotide-binding universal stress UspA family protein
VRQAFVDRAAATAAPPCRHNYGLLERNTGGGACRAAAMPLLANARRVVLAGAEERDASLATELADLSRQLAWYGINAQVDFLSSLAGPVRKVLLTAAWSHNAYLLVMGAYGHSRARQIVFGGFTQSVLESAEIAVLLMH